MTQISCKEVSINYGSICAVSKVSFKIESGEYICIIGENGSGKSTLMQGILGLIPLTSGKIIFENSLALSQVGYLPQKSLIQSDFPATVLEIVLTGFLGTQGNTFFYSKETKERALKTMETLRISGIKNKSFRKLSGGQQQRVLLARAVCSDPKIIFFDEPTTGLDPAMILEFYDIIRTLNKEKGVTVVMTSHDIQTSINEAQTIIHLDKDIKFIGGTEQYLQSDISKRFVR